MNLRHGNSNHSRENQHNARGTSTLRDPEEELKK
ncbi:hypothetical protein E2C01_092408 [Portunus trituberculatus]|uniref:Uncharacterized protein n=1 Tax=Portunus trituberculatus TaxID=210409 RepID=A0A5B7JRA4_PORTR|nr:hypothetical protein [Portunus trituberculatus]